MKEKAKFNSILKLMKIMEMKCTNLKRKIFQSCLFQITPILWTKLNSQNLGQNVNKGVLKNQAHFKKL